MVDKSAQTQAPVLDVIRDRYSARAYDKTRAISSEHLTSILEAGRWAPSAYNEQPWRFLVGCFEKTPDTYQALLEILVPYNFQWAKTAPLLILSATRLRLSHDGSDNRYRLYDVGQATENMVLQAQSFGIQSRQMALFDHDKAIERFEIPKEEFEPVIITAFGYPAADPGILNAPELEEKERAERKRKSLREIAFTGRWGWSLSGV